MDRLLKYICVAFFFLSSPLANAGQFDGFDFIYINDFGRTKAQAVHEAIMLNAMALPELGSAQVGVYFHEQTNLTRQLLETFRASNQDSNRSTLKHLWNWLGNEDVTLLAPENFFDEMFMGIMKQYDETAYVNGNKDLQDMINDVKYWLTKGKKIILVPHGHGNFYANQVVSYFKTNQPDLAPCLSEIGAATPATYVASGGPYTTVNNDKVVNRMRLVNIRVLPPSPQENAPVSDSLHDDPLAHSYPKTYLHYYSARIRTQLLGEVTKMNTAHPGNCAPPPPPPKANETSVVISLNIPNPTGTCWFARPPNPFGNPNDPVDPPAIIRNSQMGDRSLGTDSYNDVVHETLAWGSYFFIAPAANCYCENPTNCPGYSSSFYHIYYKDQSGSPQNRDIPLFDSAGRKIESFNFTVDQ